MRYLQKVTTTLTRHSSVWHASSQGKLLIQFLKIPETNVVLGKWVASITGYFCISIQISFCGVTCCCSSDSDLPCNPAAVRPNPVRKDDRSSQLLYLFPFFIDHVLEAKGQVSWPVIQFMHFCVSNGRLVVRNGHTNSLWFKLKL